MSEELRDLRCKIPSLLDEIIEAEATARGVDKCDIVREVLMDWGRVRHAAFMELQRRLTHQGRLGDLAGSSGRQKPVPSRQALRWDDP